MSHSLLTADRRTHVKIVVLALVAAIAVVATGIAAKISSNGEIARLQANGPVLKAGTPVTYTGRGAADIR